MQLHRAPEWLLPSAIPCLVCHARPDFCWKWGRGTPENSLLQCINQIHSQSKSILCVERRGGPAGKKTSTSACDLIPLNWGASSQGAKQKRFAKISSVLTILDLDTATQEKRLHSSLLEIRNSDIRLNVTLTPTKNSSWVEIFRCTVQLLWESNSKLVANVKWFSAWKLAIGDDWKHSQGASTEIKDCLLNIQDLWTFQDKLLWLFSSSHILWPMLIQALVLLHSSLQHPCQVPPYPAPQGFSSLLAQSLPGLASSATLSPWFPLLPSFPNINSHSPTESASPVHSLRHFGARTTLGSHTSHCPMGLLLALRHRGTNPASSSSSRSHSTHMPKIPCKICHFLKKLQFVSIWEFCSADKGKAVTQNLLFLPSAHH